mgnify:CR=1 FL=1
MPIRLKRRMMTTLLASKCRSAPKYSTMMAPMNTSRSRMNLPWVIR